MNTHQRVFLVSVTLAAATATPAFTQTITPAMGPNTASVPDFSGIWGHPYLTGGFEQPLSGPGPVNVSEILNLMRGSANNGKLRSWRSWLDAS